MPGTVRLMEMELDEALAILAVIAVDPGFPEFVSDADRQALQQEARRTVEHAAHEAAARYLAPAHARPSLKVVATSETGSPTRQTTETEHDRRRRRELSDGHRR